MCVSINVSAHMCVPVYVWRGQRVPLLFIPLRKHLFLNLGLMFSWLDWKPWTPGLFCGCWDLNSSPQDCTAGML